MKKSRAWKAFLPISTSLKSNEVQDADARWLASRGLDVEALSVLRCLRSQVLPVVRAISEKHALLSFHFLIHGRAEGVPCSVEDSRAFIDLSLYFYEKRDPRPMLRNWCWVAPRAVGGKNPKLTEDIITLNEQSELYLRILERCGKSDDLDALKQVRQQLHYFANMSQMMVQ